MPRLPRLDAPGAFHHVRARSAHGGLLFESDSDRLDFLERIATEVERGHIRVFGWSLQDTHSHLILESNGELSAAMQTIHSGYAREFNRRHKRRGSLMETRFRSTLVDRDTYLLNAIRYVHLNPVKAAIVNLEQLDSYPWTGHRALSGLEPCAWQEVDGALALFGKDAISARAAYRRFVADGAEGSAEVIEAGLHYERGRWVPRSALQRGREAWTFDERLAGSDRFVLDSLRRQELRQSRRDAARQCVAEVPVITEAIARSLKVSPIDILSGTRQPQAVIARSVICWVGLRLLARKREEVARALRVSLRSLHRHANRGERIALRLGLNLDDILRGLSRPRASRRRRRGRT